MKRVALVFGSSAPPSVRPDIRNVVDSVRARHGRVVTAVALPLNNKEARRITALLRRRMHAGEFEAVVPVGAAATALCAGLNIQRTSPLLGERAAIYARSASSRQGRLADQIARCTNHICGQSGVAVRTYVDGCQNGVEQMPSLQRVLKDAEAGAFSVIVADEVSRFSSDSRKLYEVVDRMKRSSVRLFEGNDPIGTAVR